MTKLYDKSLDELYDLSKIKLEKLVNDELKYTREFVIRDLFPIVEWNKIDPVIRRNLGKKMNIFINDVYYEKIKDLGIKTDGDSKNFNQQIYKLK